MLPFRCEKLRLASKLGGLDVVEFGPGPGTNFNCLGEDAATHPKSWVGVEPNGNFADAQDAAAANFTFPRETRWLKGEVVDVEAASFDAAVLTHVLCSVDDPAAVLEQAARALKPGGTLFLMEHVAADEATGLRTLQKALAPAIEIVANGCRWRETEAILRAAKGFEDLAVESFSADPMPLPFRPHILATARRSGV